MKKSLDETTGATMRWYHYAAYFFGGAFLANAIPHFVSGAFELRRTSHIVVVGLGVLLMAIISAHAFGRFYGGR